MKRFAYRFERAARAADVAAHAATRAHADALASVRRAASDLERVRDDVEGGRGRTRERFDAVWFVAARDRDVWLAGCATRERGCADALRHARALAERREIAHAAARRRAEAFVRHRSRLRLAFAAHALRCEEAEFDEANARRPTGAFAIQ